MPNDFPLSRVSIALATYNGSAYIEEQFLSLCAQTYLPNEIIVADDGSTDDTVNKLLALSCDYPQINVVVLEQKGNGGYSRNFARALEACSGDFIFMCDQDDVWHKNKISVILNEFEINSEALLIAHDLNVCDSNLKQTGQTKLERLKLLGLGDAAYVVGMATAVKRSFLQFCLPIPTADVAYDEWLHVCARALGKRSVIPQALAEYRRHESNATKGMLVNQVENVSPFSVIKTHFSAPNYLLGLQKNQIIFKHLGDLLDSKKDTVQSLASGLDDYQNVILTNQQFERAYAQRIYALSSPFCLRQFRLLVCYIRGDYRVFSGYKSFVKDFIKLHL
ncbi:glycosyltransferase [Marinagarivorans algicola]|uniref:glycosyltransferase n=1 Tax=Marinagarivorans algicola TaxID=1513270 RepID=UPI0037360E37